MEFSGKQLYFKERKNVGGIVQAESDDQQYTWKKKIYSLRSIPIQKSLSIRKVLISAIASAGKAHLVEIANELRSSLKLLRKQSGGETIDTALETLEKHGGYEVANEDYADMEVDDDGSVTDVIVDDEETTSGMLSEEATILDYHFDDYAIDRDEWRQSVLSCKTLSR